MQNKENRFNINERLESLDVLRGFDMFWIIGGAGLIITLAQTTGWAWLGALAVQMDHVSWEGFHALDLVFPLFMFTSGVTIPYAILRKLEKGASKGAMLRKAGKRAIILFLLGLLHSKTLETGFADVRIPSVLGMIGFAYFCAVVLALFTRSLRSRILWTGGIMFVYALIQFFVPVPGHGPGLFDPEWGINAWIDRLLLPGKLYGGTYDEDGILNHISAATITMMGLIAGTLLRDGKKASSKKALVLLLTGSGLIITALLLSTFYPIIHWMRTVSFTTLTGGISFCMLSTLYFIIDVKGWKGGLAGYAFFFFRVIGVNSILIYMLGTSMVDFKHISGFFLGALSNHLGEWVLWIGVIIIEWILLYFLFKKRIFLRV